MFSLPDSWEHVPLATISFNWPESATGSSTPDRIKPFSSCISRSQHCDKLQHGQHTGNYRPSSILGQQNGAPLEDGRLWERSMAAQGCAPHSPPQKKKTVFQQRGPNYCLLFCYRVSKKALAPFRDSHQNIIKYSSCVWFSWLLSNMVIIEQFYTTGWMKNKKINRLCKIFYHV